MATLNLNGNYAEQMLSMYLWGQLTPPSPSEISDDKWIRPKHATTTVSVDTGAYMSKIGHHLKLAEQKMFQLFFNNEYRVGGEVSLPDIANVGIKNGNEIILNHKQFVELFYKDLDRNTENEKIFESAEKAEFSLYHTKQIQNRKIIGNELLPLVPQNLN